MAADQLVVVGGGQQPPRGGQGGVEAGHDLSLVARFERHLGDDELLYEVVELFGRHTPSLPYERPDRVVCVVNGLTVAGRDP